MANPIFFLLIREKGRSNKTFEFKISVNFFCHRWNVAEYLNQEYFAQNKKIKSKAKMKSKKIKKPTKKQAKT